MSVESLTQELYEPLIQGIKDGRRESLEEAPYIHGILGFKPDYDTLRKMPIELGHLPQGVLGVTQIAPEGKAVGMRISQYIAPMVAYAKEKYGRTKEWAKRMTYQIGKDTTNHEDYHVLSAGLAKGEEVDDDARDVMESITTRGRYKVAKALGKHEKASWVEKTNPYPSAWRLAEIADWAPYESESGRGYSAFLKDASKERFWKPLGRLTWAAAKAGLSKGREYISGRTYSGAMAYAA